MRRAASLLGALALLAVPLAWMIPIAETCGWNQCLPSSAEVGLTLFLYFLLWGWTVSYVRQRGGGVGILWDTVWYVNLPITLVYIYRATNWQAPFTCG